MSEAQTELPYADGEPPLSGRIRVEPEDFQVFEDLGYAPDGEGEHVLLRVRKRGANTPWVASRLAAYAEVKPNSVSYAGLKDRWAVTEQWFSVWLPGRAEPDWQACNSDEFQILQAVRHRRKIKRGGLRGNAFRIVIRDLEGDLEALSARFQGIQSQGVPHYFGPQRFGHNGANLARARAMFTGRRERDRNRRSLYLSAARAEVFNQVLAARVKAGSWDQGLHGDVFILNGSRSFFTEADISAELEQRLQSLDIHPSGPLWGRGELASQAEAGALERAVASTQQDLCTGLEQAGLEQERRALRLLVSHGRLEIASDDRCAIIEFELPAGSYATVVLRELIKL